MDSFRGSIPPNVISFCLENQTTEVVNSIAEPTATTSAASPPTKIGPQIQNPSVPQELSRSQADDITSTHSADSDPEVTSYAESMFQRMQQAQLTTAQEEDHPESVPLQSQEQVNDPPGLVLTTAENRRSSTSIQSDEEEVQEADLSALESALRVIEASESQLPELRNRNDSDQVDASGVQSRIDEDNASSICDVPALPGGDPKVRLAEGLGEEEESTGESSLLVPVELYGRPAFAPDYDPWTYVDNFGRSKIYKSLLASYRTALSTPQKSLVRSVPEDQCSVADMSAVKAPSSTKRRKMERRASRASSSSTAGASEPGSSKD